MPLFDPMPEEIDISEKEEAQEGAEATQLPDEVEVKGGEEDGQEKDTPPEEGSEDNKPDNSEGETTTEEEGQEKTPDQGSLTSEPEAQPDLTTDQEAELDDSKVLTYLSEKLGKEVTSLEDLSPAEATDPFNGDEELKAIAEWRDRTGRPVSDYFKFQKDYDKMEPAEAVRENLRLKYPEFSEDEINLEMQELVADPDMDSDDDIARKNLKLKKEAITAKQELNKYKSNFDTPDSARLSKEQQEAINFYQKYQEQSTKSQGVMESYQKGVTSESNNLKSIPLKLSDDLSIDLNISPEESKALPKQILETPNWYNEDGSYNTSAIVKDAAKMRHFDKAVQLAFEQGVASGKEQEDVEGRNVNFDKNRPTNTSSKQDEIIVEGADNFEEPKMRFGRRR